MIRRIKNRKGFDCESKFRQKFVEIFDFTVKALISSILEIAVIPNEDRYDSKNLLLYYMLYTELDFSLKKAKSQTTKVFRFRISYLEKVDCKPLENNVVVRVERHFYQ